MARPLRLEVPDGLFHLTARGNARQRIWLDDSDASAFFEVLTTVVGRYGWQCHAYCLLSNHYHLLVSAPRMELSHGARQLNGVYAQAFNRRHGRVGHVFQGRFKAILVQRDPHLLELSRYVVLNPVRAGLCSRAEDWRWSSYRATAGIERSPSFLSTDGLLAAFGGSRRLARERYRAFVSNGADGNPWERLRSDLYLGDEAFLAQHPGTSVSREHPRAQRQPLRPPLAELLPDESAETISRAHREHGYRLTAIAEQLGIHPATAGRRLRRLEE
jgi:REP element-mobilizing transposase RayT